MSKIVSIGNELLPIRKFKLNSMCKNPSIAIIAKKASGKTILCATLLKYLFEEDNISEATIISPTEYLNHFYGKKFPNSFIHKKYSRTITQNLLNRQYEMKLKQEDHRTVLLMDDCLGVFGEWQKDENFDELISNGRHHGVTTITTFYNPLGIGPTIRGNFDYVFIMRDDNIKNIQRIYDNYADIFPTKELFEKTFPALTQDFGCMVLVNRGVGNNFFSDRVCWFKADINELEDYNFKSKPFINCQYDNYEEEYKKKPLKITI
ncbi:MAG: hypothetical protein CMF62_00360 [Magnetococcales bacterium]|nr:hypothetical protein [Magnetococcales bacterium]|tara:strand:- start:20101 stop:20889 length:789 start_codon:yes stop_codon:yes gene_type:complete